MSIFSAFMAVEMVSLRLPFKVSLTCHQHISQIHSWFSSKFIKIIYKIIFLVSHGTLFLKCTLLISKKTHISLESFLCIVLIKGLL